VTTAALVAFAPATVALAQQPAGGPLPEGGIARGAQVPEAPTGMVAARPLVAVYGVPGQPRLGALGRGSPPVVGDRLELLARRHSTAQRPGRPTFDLVTTLATREAGRDRRYRRRLSIVRIAPYLAEARERDGALLLDLQPGRSTFLTEARAYETLLREPETGLALDPEWNMGPRGRPGRGLGRVTAAEVNRVSAWLDDLVVRHGLPAKDLVVHQFTTAMVSDRAAILQRPNVRVTLEMDGHGTAAAKQRSYERLATLAPQLYQGLMIFERRDRGALLTQRHLQRLAPVPSYIGYQ